jgi:phosphate:Na+ symporter
VLIPFSKQLVQIAEHAIKEDEIGTAFLDLRLLITPSIAVAECRKKTTLVVEKAVEGICLSMSLLMDYDSDKKYQIKLLEEEVDEMVEACNQFLIQLSGKSVSKSDNLLIADMLHSLGDMERISDYSLGLSQTAKKIAKADFSNKKEFIELICSINNRLMGILGLVAEVYCNRSREKAVELIADAEKVVLEIKKIKKKDLKSLRNGKGEPEASVYLTDYLTICRRVAEHSINIMEEMVI